MKPVILWIADIPGWAYDPIVKGVAKLLPQYEHVIYYACVTMDPAHALLNYAAAGADVVISMYLRYQEWLRPEHKKKVATMITGFRPFERHKE
jgi:hypothetical protein